ncbi:MAG: hypothetical protein MHM6MM_003679 [Cercozoa sp. M6MM]
MASLSGIKLADAALNAVSTVCTGENIFVQLRIKDEQFEVLQQHPGEANAAADFAALATTCTGREPWLAVLRNRASVTPQKTLLLVAFVPTSAKVSDRMIYASSRDAVKSAVGASQFEPDLQVETASDCSLKEYLSWRDHANANTDLRTDAEKEKAEADRASKLELGGGSQGMRSLPVQPDASSTSALSQLKTTPASVALALFSLDANETMHAETVKQNQPLSPSEVASRLPQDEPRFVVYRWNSPSNGTKYIFLYWCPSGSNPRQRMFYSLVKQSLSAAMEELGIQIDKKMEIDSTQEIASDAVLQAELFPKAVAETTSFARPKRPGRPGRGRRLPKKATF